jgi:hypothetical protein
MNLNVPENFSAEARYTMIVMGPEIFPFKTKCHLIKGLFKTGFTVSIKQPVTNVTRMVP